MLFFELFPAFVTIVAAIVGTMLFFADRRASRDPNYRETPPRPPEPVTPEQADAERRTVPRRPSMRS